MNSAHVHHHVIRKLIILLLLVTPLAGHAQQTFTQLDWNELRIDSVLPHYTEVVPLETDYHLFTYYARVRYPEWMPLTKEETVVAERFADQLADTLRIETYVGVSRGQGLIALLVRLITLSSGCLIALSGGLAIG